MPNPTPSDRLALALCRSIATSLGDYPTCSSPCSECREQSAAVAAEVATILRERHGGSSQVADWLDGVGHA
jgi:hypothetical protein